jgi:hypothetical protein
MSGFDRVVGVFQVLGGGLEIALGSAGVVTPEPMTTAGGVLLIAHGSDTLIAGFKTLWYGEVQESLTKQAAESTAEAFGASPEMADRIGVGVDIFAGVGPSSGIAISRQIALTAAKNTKAPNIALAYIRKEGILRGTGHNMVGIATESGSTAWFHFMGKTPGRFVRGKAPNADAIVARFAISLPQAARATNEASRLGLAGNSMWRVCGPNCTTTATSVLREAGILVPHWSVTPLLLAKGMRPQYITVVGAKAGTVTPPLTRD